MRTAACASVPSRFEARHVYSLAANVTVKKKLTVLTVVLSSGRVDVTVTELPGATSGSSISMLSTILVHVISGAGTPSAVQVRVALLGDTTVVSLGGVVMLAGTVYEQNSNIIFIHTFSEHLTLDFYLGREIQKLPCQLASCY